MFKKEALLSFKLNRDRIKLINFLLNKLKYKVY